MGQTLWYALGIWDRFIKGRIEGKKEDSGFYSEWDKKPLWDWKADLEGPNRPLKGIWLLYFARWKATASF